jgi:glutamine synthetase
MEIKPMINIIAEYIWLDGDKPQKLRSKTKVIKEGDLENLPIWNYDGSSTNQADTDNSEILLKPNSWFHNPFKYTQGYLNILVMCETLLPNGEPHPTNNRYKLENLVKSTPGSENTKYGFEQEYTMFNKKYGRPLGWSHQSGTYPSPQGNYYCGVGANHVVGRDIAEKHLEMCLKAGISVSGINAEVMLGQWEYQVGPVGPLNGSDQLWVSRYILYKIGEEYNVEMNIDPKPIESEDWNGSGMHVNFSTQEMNDKFNIESGKSMELIEIACSKLEKKHNEHISVYGENNDKRMTGKNETSDINSFSWGYGSRTTSIRIPTAVKEKKVGYLEDRRPASNADPYLVVYKLIETIMSSD